VIGCSSRERTAWNAPSLMHLASRPLEVVADLLGILPAQPARVHELDERLTVGRKLPTVDSLRVAEVLGELGVRPRRIADLGRTDTKRELLEVRAEP
jgi:hypothetical protein